MSPLQRFNDLLVGGNGIGSVLALLFASLFSAITTYALTYANARRDRTRPLKTNNLVKLLLGGALVMILWCATIVGGTIAFERWEQAANFGDMFGALTSLFTGLGLVGVAVTIHIQTRQIAQQQADLKHERDKSRNELAELQAQTNLARGSLDLETRRVVAAAKPALYLERGASRAMPHNILSVDYRLGNLGAAIILEDFRLMKPPEAQIIFGRARTIASGQRFRFQISFDEPDEWHVLRARYLQPANGGVYAAYFQVHPLSDNVVPVRIKPDPNREWLDTSAPPPTPPPLWED